MNSPKVFLCSKGYIGFNEYAGEFWTGTGWTTVKQFAQEYDFHDALKILRKRFAKKYPQPKIIRCSKFVRKIKRKKRSKKDGTSVSKNRSKTSRCREAGQ